MSRQLSVKLPKDYKMKFERINRDYDLGYGSFPEFIKDCMRRRFEEVDNEYGDEADLKKPD
ncbi:MAG: hypothetical protein EAX95_13985 [Candidatus Thorarchaeota archaeon]|nr:hypothetical protein [Candidatus Thorarchaeota archaeon]